METLVGQKKFKNLERSKCREPFGHAHHIFVSPSPVDGPAEIRNLNHPNANHNA
jgi:hypothetical protein